MLRRLTGSSFNILYRKIEAFQARDVHEILLAAERGRRAVIHGGGTEMLPEEVNPFTRNSPEWLAFNMGWLMHHNPGKRPF